jgi:hypothetical protein
VFFATIQGLSVETEGSLTIYARELYSPDPNRREEAARQLWLRFSERLVAQVRRRLDPRILRRTGAEDVVQNLFAAFFDADPGPNGPPRNRAELWRRLVHFTMCAVANTVDYHQAQRRDYRRETPFGEWRSWTKPSIGFSQIEHSRHETTHLGVQLTNEKQSLGR